MKKKKKWEKFCWDIYLKKATPTITITRKVKKFKKLKKSFGNIKFPPVWMFGRAQLQYFTWWPSAWTGNQ